MSFAAILSFWNGARLPRKREQYPPSFQQALAVRAHRLSVAFK
jgi:hypothetical protein